MQLPRREGLRERGVVVHLQDTEKLGEKDTKKVASVYALAVGSRIGRSMVLHRSRAQLLICGVGSNRAEAATRLRSLNNGAEALGSQVVILEGRESICRTETRAV